MSATPRRGPARHRILVFVFSVVFALLFYWLLGFILTDIGRWPGPDYDALEEQLLDSGLAELSQSLAEDIDTTRRQISQLRNRQALLKDSISNSEQTMDQLLEIQRLSLEKESELAPEEQQAMGENIQLFLSNQRQYQTLNDELSQLNEQLTSLEDRKRANDQQLESEREPIRETYRAQLERHNLRLAVIKLAVLIPQLLIVGALFLKKPNSIYSSLIYAGGIAISAKVLVVMHEHFPARYIKYVLILVSLTVVTSILVYLLRMLAFPKQDWLLKQFREAYEAFLCPICGYPIRRGPLKYTSWTRRSIRKISLRRSDPGSVGEDSAYTCPTCGSQLFEECDSCHEIRHSLLPACEKCGATRPVDFPVELANKSSL